MKLNQQQAMEILRHPFINFAAVAKAFYNAEDSQGEEARTISQSLRNRTIVRVENGYDITPKTLQRLECILEDLEELFIEK